MTATLEDVASELYDQWGTLNTAADPTKLDKSHTPRAQNVWPDKKPGSIVTVEGYTKIGDLPSGNPARFLYTFTKSDGSSIVLASDNGTVYKTSDFINFTSIITGLSSSYQLRAATIRDKAWLTNGQDAVRTYDGSTVVVLDGNGGTPNVPKGKFIAIWHERVWLGDVTSARSSARFSALVDSSGNDIAPDHASAWPASNAITFGTDDGDVLCGLKPYLGVLHVFKANSIYRVDGTDEFTYQPFKTTATTGCRIQESIQERNDLLEFIGKDGVYEFDGNTTTKVSEAIESIDLNQFSFSNIQQGTNQSLTRAWTTEGDFTAGTLTGITATRQTGSLLVDNYTYAADLLPASDTPAWTKATGRTTSESVSGGILSLSCTTGSQAGQGSAYIVYTRTESGLSNSNGTRVRGRAKITSTNGSDSEYFGLTIFDGTVKFQLRVYHGVIKLMAPTSTPGSPAASYTMNTVADYHIYDLMIVGSTVTVYVDGSLVITYGGSGAWSAPPNPYVEFGCTASGLSITASCLVDYVSVCFNVNGTASVLSDVYHIADTIASWGAFIANYTLNGGAIAFSIRSGTSEANCEAAEWTAISSGATIAFNTANVYVQWRAVFTISGTNSPELDDVTIAWNTGSGSVVTTQPVASIVFNDRYWLAGALTGSSSNDVVIVRGKRLYGTPWVKLNGFNIVAFCIYNRQLYAASSTNDDLLRLDTGNSLNGSALDSYWETRDDVGGADEIFYKRYPIVIVSGTRQGNYTLTVDISTDGGNTFPSGYQKTISLSGTGRFSTELRYPNLRGKQIRVRVRTNGVDQPFEVSSIRIFWRKKFLR